ncbi:MarR family winged helix-turn-helix transcriptional regulator [Mycobacterium lehmannii]|uniref:MarR family winged helix-turn-helix transcriptional regulator n=1 Tax=Mycobacterium lehmannii TaxID=2048550 RepID=UPI000B940F38|nr:MarR family transcriptional regulator [Mycobacterium lehmannii]
MHDGQLINVLGACSLAISDLLTGVVTETAHTSRSGSSALGVLLQAGDLSVSELGRRIGLSQPAAARMVDSLERLGYVRRQPGGGREVQVTLTRAGARTARRLLQRRSELMTTLLKELDDDEIRALSTLLNKVATNVYRQLGNANVICRLCDRRECVSTAPRCPVGLAAGEPPGA